MQDTPIDERIRNIEATLGVVQTVQREQTISMKAGNGRFAAQDEKIATMARKGLTRTLIEGLGVLGLFAIAGAFYSRASQDEVEHLGSIVQVVRQTQAAQAEAISGVKASQAKTDAVLEKLDTKIDSILARLPRKRSQ